MNFRIIRNLGFEWSIFAGTGYYDDTGEIEQSNLATDAAPELETVHWNTGINWKAFDGSRQVAFSIGKYEQNYSNDQLDQRFRNLYSQRDWWLFRISYTQQF